MLSNTYSSDNFILSRKCIDKLDKNQGDTYINYLYYL